MCTLQLSTTEFAAQLFIVPHLILIQRDAPAWPLGWPHMSTLVGERLGQNIVGQVMVVAIDRVDQIGHSRRAVQHVGRTQSELHAAMHADRQSQMGGYEVQVFGDQAAAIVPEVGEDHIEGSLFNGRGQGFKLDHGHIGGQWLWYFGVDLAHATDTPGWILVVLEIERGQLVAELNSRGGREDRVWIVAQLICWQGKGLPQRAQTGHLILRLEYATFELNSVESIACDEISGVGDELLRRCDG